jgi:alpha-beta hydrolase superfamily lysophospholipase
MDTITNPKMICPERRRLFGVAAVAIAAAGFGMIGSENAQSSEKKTVPANGPGTNACFRTFKQITAGVLNSGYAEAGPADGHAVLLLHGRPYDIHSYAEVAALLASAGYRVIIPHLRGYGTTRFLSTETPPNRSIVQ